LHRSDSTSPLLLVATGSSNYELSLLNLEHSTVELLFTVDDRASRESFVAGLPNVPSFEREMAYPDYKETSKLN